MQPPPTHQFFPYTTLFRSREGIVLGGKAGCPVNNRQVHYQLRHRSGTWKNHKYDGATSSYLCRHRIYRWKKEVLPQNGRLNRSEEHTSELQSRPHLVCRLL